jgi:hypothetical protein
MLVRICDELDCTADYLIGRTKHRHGMILEKDSLPEQLKGIDVKLEVVKTINESGLSEKQIKHALWLYKQYEKYHNDDRE